MAITRELERPQPRLIPWTRKLEAVPWWMLILLLAGLLIVYAIYSSKIYQDAFLFLLAGLKLTIVVTLASFSIAIVLGLIAGLGRVSKNIIFYNLSTLYVEMIRGVPLLVQLLYVAFVLVPWGVDLLNVSGRFMLQHASSNPFLGIAHSFANLNIKDVDMTVRAIIGLAFGYGAFEAEVFRGGIQSIERGQMEAARSLGMSYFQAMRYIILPQAIRRMLPPLGNDFIAMLKDSSLISALAVRELTQLGKLHRSRTFRTFEAWNTVAFLYLIMTLSLSLVVKFMERRMAFED